MRNPFKKPQNFNDLSEKKQKELILGAAKDSNRMQRELVEKYDEQQNRSA